MRRLIEDVGDHLESIGIGTVGTNIFVGTMPDTPVSCLALFDNGGPTSNNRAPLFTPSFQILIRKERGNLTGAARLADYVFTVLDNNWQASTRIKGRIQASTLPGANYRDASGNWIFPLNFQATLAFTSISSPTTL